MIGVPASLNCLRGSPFGGAGSHWLIGAAPMNLPARDGDDVAVEHRPAVGLLHERLDRVDVVVLEAAGLRVAEVVDTSTGEP